MKTRDFFFNLPESSIAQVPPQLRGESRLMIVDRVTGVIKHNWIKQLTDLITPDTTIVLNDSRVRKARIYGMNERTGGRVEFLFIQKEEPFLWRVITSKSKKQKPGNRYIFPGNITGTIAENPADERLLMIDQEISESYFETFGHVPLPPYIKREDADFDAERYQTVYSNVIGSVAAPTAGLHFTGELIEQLKARGINVLYVTLHVGLGTFLPIRSDNIEDHKMHIESYQISNETAEAINKAKAANHKIMAVGTTVVRTLESAFKTDKIEAGSGTTDIYIYPGYRFKVIDTLLTNFHTPESTLLLLVSAFASPSLISHSYQEAINTGYRFFSYGDAMLIL